MKINEKIVGGGVQKCTYQPHKESEVAMAS